MASKDILTIGPEAKKDPKTQALDSIANIMEDILHDMKSQIEQTKSPSPLQMLKLKENGVLKPAPVKLTTVDLSGDRTPVKGKKIETTSVKKVVKQDTRRKDSPSISSTRNKKKSNNSKIMFPLGSSSIASKKTVSHSNIIHPEIKTTAIIHMKRPQTEESKLENRSRTLSVSRRNNNQKIRGKSMNTTSNAKSNILSQTSKLATNKRTMSLPPKASMEMKTIDRKQYKPNSVSNQVKHVMEQLTHKVNNSNKTKIINQKTTIISKQFNNKRPKSFNITNIKQLVLSTMRNNSAKKQLNNKKITQINKQNDRESLRSMSNNSKVQNKPNNKQQFKSNTSKTPNKSSNPKNKSALQKTVSTFSKQSTISKQREHIEVVTQKDIIKSIIQTNRINMKPKIEQIHFLQELLPKIMHGHPHMDEKMLPKDDNPEAQEKFDEIAKARITKQEKIIEFAKALARKEMLETLADQKQLDVEGKSSVNVPKNNHIKSHSVYITNVNKPVAPAKCGTMPIAKKFPTSLLKKISEERKKYEAKFKENLKEWNRDQKKLEIKKEENKNTIVIRKDSGMPVKLDSTDTQIRNIENRVNEYQLENKKSGPPPKFVFKPLTQQFTNITNLNFIKPVIKSIYPTSSPNRSRASMLPASNMQPIARTISNKYISPMEVIKDLVDMVNRAKRDRKTFTVCGNFFSIRRAFAERGWVEKVRICVSEKDTWKKLEGLTNIELVEGIRDKEHGDKYRRVLLSKLLSGHQVDFYWDYITNPFVVNSDKVKRTIINRFPNGATRSYTTKPGLCESLKEAPWVYIEGFSNIMFPRTYNLHGENERKSFVEDFRTTACISMLKWVNCKFTNEVASAIMSTDGKISVSVYNFAVLQCQNILKCHCHKDIDMKIPEAKDNEWDTYLDRFYKIIHQNQHFMQSDTMRVEGMVEQSRYILDRLREYYPQLNNDGMMNLWLLKPHYGSRGCGIHVCRTLKYMLETCHNRVDIQYIAQKYIERPLLIHDTKFDIRQYILVTSIPTLKIWMYKECYLKFSSQKFNLNRLDESVHLTNNSVQIKYKNCDRSNKLPDDNMWHSDEFRRYLIESGYPFAWRNVIYKGMKEILIGLFMLCQDKLITRVNSFELCGADFMIDENFQPYLLEINARPALGPSTKITARLCPKVLEDVVKVTVDNARNPNSSTGNFELILKDTWNFKIQKTPDLCIEGYAYGCKEHEKPKYLPLKREVHEKTNAIQRIFKVDPTTVKKEPIKTLKQILSVISKTKNTINIENQTEKNRLFKCLMAEYVDIISGNSNHGE